MEQKNSLKKMRFMLQFEEWLVGIVHKERVLRYCEQFKSHQKTTLHAQNRKHVI